MIFTFEVDYSTHDLLKQRRLAQCCPSIVIVSSESIYDAALTAQQMPAARGWMPTDIRLVDEQ